MGVNMDLRDIFESFFYRKKKIIDFVGPDNLWPWPIYSLGPKARAEEGYS